MRFLVAGGEMGERTRAYDWASSPLGTPDQWPQSLRTVLDIILHSRFPMFLWWGPQLICFYNDAYRPSLGKEGKHPAILGMPAEEAWPEIWDTIKPLIDNVLQNGEATWSEDQLIPIYRNNAMEDVYWTFSYSPVADDYGNRAGVLVTCTETTDKIKSLERIEESKKQLQFAIDAAKLGTFDYNPITEKFIANNRLKEWFGLPADQEISINHAIMAIAEKDKERVTDAIQKALEYESGGDYDIQYSIVHPGTLAETIVHARGKAWFDEKHIPYRFNGILEDVTAEANALAKIIESEHMQRAAIDAISGILWTNNPDGMMEGEQPGWAELTGQTYNQYQGYGWSHVIHPDDVQPTIDEWQLSVKEQRPFIFEHRVMKKNGRWGHFSIHAIPIIQGNTITKWVGVHIDITRQKLVEQELLAREEKFRMLADSMPQLVWTGDAEGKLNYFNQSVYHYSGLGVEEIAENGWLQIVHPDERDANIAAWLHSVHTGEVFWFEHRFRRHDGEYRWHLSRASPQRNLKGEIKMWVGTSTDIHDQKTSINKLETLVLHRTKELREKNAELEKMNAELQSFAYVSSHDLQEPLRKIRTFTDRILEKENDNLSENGKYYFSRIHDASKRTSRLISDLLTYARTNAADRVFETNDLVPVIETLKEELKEELEEKKASIVTGQLVPVDMIPFQFHQLLQNLISNSLKFADKDRAPLIHISSEYMTDNEDVSGLPEGTSLWHLIYTDNGIGFEPEYSDRIFEVFQRLHSYGEYQGTGIGLAIVKKIVENHNGSIIASGTPGQGARFDIYLPVKAMLS